MILYIDGLNENLNKKSFKIEFEKDMEFIAWDISTINTIKDISSGDNYIHDETYTTYKLSIIKRYEILEVYYIDKNEILKVYNMLFNTYKKFMIDEHDIYLDYNDYLDDIKEV